MTGAPPKCRTRQHDGAPGTANHCKSTAACPLHFCRAEVRLSTAFHNYGNVFGRRGARIARREEEEYREYLTDEQRSEAGCIGGRDVAVIVKRSTKGRRTQIERIIER